MGKTKNKYSICHHMTNDFKCQKYASYNYSGETKRIFCTKHKLEGMVDIRHHKCIYDGCTRNAYFNFTNLNSVYDMNDLNSCSTNASTNALYCSIHKSLGMLNVITKKCRASGCFTFPNFNYADNGVKTGIYCSLHKLDGMIDVKNRKCRFIGCPKRPFFNYFGQSSGIYCSTHKQDDMIDVKNKHCSYLSDVVKSCPKRAYFNYIGHSVGVYCATHKLDGMVNIKRKHIFHQN